MSTRYLLAAWIVAGSMLRMALPCPAGETPNKEKLGNLIEQLGSSNFGEREKASKELEAIGLPALEALRQAAKSDDAEVRKRAEALLPRIEMQAESIRVLAPKRVHLAYKDTPLGEAVADLQKQSGYSLRLHEPDDKLKQRKITLDTGETTFWHAVALFCDKAELKEASMEDLAQPAPRGAGVPGPRRIFVPGMSGQLIFKAGKAAKAPADERGAIRIRALAKTDLFGKVPEGEILLPLEVTPEPRLQVQIYQSIRVDKAVDDRGQELVQVIPQVQGAAGIGGNLVLAPPGVAAGMNAGQVPFIARHVIGWGGLSQQLPLQFKKGGKDAKALKEVKGSITARLLAEPRPVIAADKLDKAAGKTFKGEDGGSIKIIGFASEAKQTTIELECEPPSYEKIAPVQPNMAAGVLRLGVAAQAVKVQPMPAPPPPPVPNGRGGAAVGGPPLLLDNMNGLSIQDDKGNTLPIDRRRSSVQMSLVQQGNGGAKRTVTYTLCCPHDKDKKKPAKVVYLGRKRATVEIPFALKDVPLPAAQPGS